MPRSLALCRPHRDRLFQQSFLSLCLLSVVAIGCGKDPEIRSYTVPKDTPKAASSGALPMAAAESVPGRMIAGIVLREGEAWFFKLFGEKKAVDAVADDVRAFIASLELPEDKPRAVTWTIPEDWKEGPPRPMGKLTLVLPGEGEPLAIAVSTLNFGGDADPFLLANITRWSGQLALPAIEALDEKNGIEKLPLEGGEVWLYDAVGTKSAGGRGGMPPFAGRAAMQPSHPTGTPPAATGLAPDEPGTIELDVPEDWTELPRGSMGSRGFAAGEKDQAVVMKAYDFPPVRAMADPRTNINRWRGEVGLAEIAQDELADYSEALEIDGVEGVLTEMAAEDGSKATIAAMFEKEGRVWFFKMTGTKAGTDAYRDEFLTWLKSVRIGPPASKESPDKQGPSEPTSDENSEGEE